MAAEIEKVVINANRAHIQNLLPDSGELQFELITRRSKNLRGFLSESIRRRQGAAINFARRRQRQTSEDHKQRRHHVIRQLLLQKVAHLINVNFGALASR